MTSMLMLIICGSYVRFLENSAVSLDDRFGILTFTFQFSHKFWRKCTVFVKQLLYILSFFLRKITGRISKINMCVRARVYIYIYIYTHDICKYAIKLKRLHYHSIINSNVRIVLIDFY